VVRLCTHIVDALQLCMDTALERFPSLLKRFNSYTVSLNLCKKIMLYTVKIPFITSGTNMATFNLILKQR
jgi:hypothetical protein